MLDHRATELRRLSDAWEMIAIGYEHVASLSPEPEKSKHEHTAAMARAISLRFARCRIRLAQTHD